MLELRWQFTVELKTLAPLKDGVVFLPRIFSRLQKKSDTSTTICHGLRRQLCFAAAKRRGGLHKRDTSAARAPKTCKMEPLKRQIFTKKRSRLVAKKMPLKVVNLQCGTKPVPPCKVWRISRKSNLTNLCWILNRKWGRKWNKLSLSELQFLSCFKKFSIQQPGFIQVFFVIMEHQLTQIHSQAANSWNQFVSAKDFKKEHRQRKVNI